MNPIACKRCQMGIASFSFPCIRKYYGAGVLRPQIEPKSNEVVCNSENSIRYLDKARIDFSSYVTYVVLNEPSKENEILGQVSLWMQFCTTPYSRI